jgi:hypothetical protein
MRPLSALAAAPALALDGPKLVKTEPVQAAGNFNPQSVNVAS